MVDHRLNYLNTPKASDGVHRVPDDVGLSDAITAKLSEFEKALLAEVRYGNDLAERNLMANLAVLMALIDHGELTTSPREYLEAADDLAKEIA